MTPTPLSSIAAQLMQSPKGILAADESNKSSDKRFLALGIECSPESRRTYRQLLLTAPKFAQYINGVILYDETIHQSTNTGTPFPRLLVDQGILVGIKVDTGLVPFTNFEPETITEGLDGLANRLTEYYKLGARFTKWRSAFAIDVTGRLPTTLAIHANLNAMARYATLVQAAGMVPIVEPEVVYEGDHDLKTSQEVTSQVLRVLFELLKAYRVDLTGIILKTSMVLGGSKHGDQSSPEEVAEATLQVLRERVPAEVAGVVFLSGGQSPDQATANLNAIGASGPRPWPITFSYSRAIQEPALAAWLGKTTNVEAAQAQFGARLAANSAATTGDWNGEKSL